MFHPLKRSPTLLQWFSLLCLIATLLFGLGFGWIVTSWIECSMGTAWKEVVASVVAEAVVKNISAEELASPKYGREYELFGEKLKRLAFGPDVLRIKVWGKNGVVLWSDAQELVGKRFEDNKKLHEALHGEVAMMAAASDPAENTSEQSPDNLLELYIPIKFPPDHRVEAVFDVYAGADRLQARTRRHKNVIWASTLVGMCVLYLVLYAIFRRASLRIESQSKHIRRSEERYRSLVHCAQDGIVSTDRQGKIVLFNEAAESIFGRPAEAVIGQDLAILMPEKQGLERDGAERFLGGRLELLLDRTVELEGRRADGEVFPLELSLSTSGEGPDEVRTGIIRDISQRKKMQRSLLESQRQETISLMAGMIGHELKNALAALSGYAELLQENSRDDRLGRECTEAIIDETQRMALQANNLSSLGKPPKAEVRPLEVNPFLDKATDMLVTSGVLKFFKIVRNYSPELPPIQADQNLLEQLVRNLEINAAHAMGSTGTLTLTTGLSPDGSGVEIAIGDTGSGIPPERLEKIFHPFFTTKGEGKGTGLGLYIVKQIVEQHNGHLQIDSKVAEGTTVRVSLPVVRVAAALEA